MTTPPVAVADPSASASKRAARREAKRKRDLQAAGVEDQPADVPRRSAAPPEGPPPGRSSSREAQAEPPAPPAATSDASSPGVQSGLHWGIGGCLGTAIGLAIVAFAAAMAVDAALQAFVTSDVARTVAAALDDGASAPRRRAVEGPLVLGPPQAELTVAVAFDPSERAGALAVAEVLAWVDAQQASFAPERAPRVVLLPVAGGEDETPVRTVLALRHLGVPDDAWRAPLAEARALSMTDLAAIASAHAIAEDNLKRAAASAEIELQLRSTRSIARAFGLGPPAGVAVHGVALPVTAWASSATLAQALAPALQRVVDARAIVGDDDARQAAVLGDLPPAQASRWQRWILRGERVEAGSEPEAAEPPPSPAAAVAPQPALLQPPVSAPRRGGPADAAVQIVFVADLHCPFSRRTWDVLRQIERDFGDDVSLVFVHRPIDKLHPQARAAARHAVAAHDQGRFWDAIDWYFGKRKAKDAELAAALELDAAGAAALAAAAAGATTAATVEEHVAWARDQGVTGTPTTFVDGLALRGAQTFRRIQSAVEQAIQARASGRGAAPAPQP